MNKLQNQQKMITTMIAVLFCILLFLSITILYVGDAHSPSTFASASNTTTSTHNGKISCNSKDPLKCYFKIIFKISKLNPEEKTTVSKYMLATIQGI